MTGNHVTMNEHLWSLSLEIRGVQNKYKNANQTPPVVLAHLLETIDKNLTGNCYLTLDWVNKQYDRVRTYELAVNHGLRIV